MHHKLSLKCLITGKLTNWQQAEVQGRYGTVLFSRVTVYKRSKLYISRDDSDKKKSRMKLKNTTANPHHLKRRKT